MVLCSWTSFNRTAGTDASFTLLAKKTVGPFSQCRLRNCTMGGFLYNVTSSDGRNTLYFTVSDDDEGTNATDYAVSIPVGNYGWFDLKDALEAAINAELDPVTVEFDYNNTSLKCSVRISGGKYIKINSNQARDLNIILGFSKSSDTAYGTDITSPRVVNLVRYPYVTLCTNILRDRSYISAANEMLGILDTIPVPAPGEIIQYIPNHPTNFFNMGQSHVNSASFFILDPEGNVVDLNGAYLNVTLEMI